MAQTAQVTGTVQYREGDGPLLTIRKGPVEIEKTDQDVVLSWTETESEESPGTVRNNTALPMVDYQRFVAEGAIREDG